MSKASDNECFRKAQLRNDETFTLVGQDRSSAKLVCLWIAENISSAPEPKLREALDCAIVMRNRIAIALAIAMRNVSINKNAD